MGRRDEIYFIEEDTPHWGRRILLTLLVLVLVSGIMVFLWNFSLVNRVQLLRQKVTVANLPGDLENWTIMHISDLQGKEFGEKQANIAALVSSANVSSVVLSGDMIGPEGNVQPLLDLLDILPKDKPKLLMLGDSDPDWLDGTAHGNLTAYADWVIQAMEHGATILDEPVCFTRNKSNIWFVPEYLYSLDLDSMENVYLNRLAAYEGKALTADQAAEKRVVEYQLNLISSLREKKAAITQKDIQIAVTHTPLTADYVSTVFTWNVKEEPFGLRHASLILSGHYCGGGWRIPGGNAIYVDGLGWQPADNQIMGMTYLSGIPQYISPGLASNPEEKLPGRVFNQPTITIIALTSDMV